MTKRDYPDKPIAGVGAVILKGNELLLIKRGHPPMQGSWSLPGGRVKENETLDHALQREVWEECSITITVMNLIDIFEYIERDEENRIKYHYVVFDFITYYKSGLLHHASDAADALWVRQDALSSMVLTDMVRKIIRQGIEMQKSV